MTKIFDRLQESPQTDVDVGSLNMNERQQVRRITVKGTPGRTQQNRVGKFTPVYYLVGEEKEAAERFVEENRTQIEKINFSKRNIIDANVSREIYDWILHAAGERTLTKFETVIREKRPDGSEWIIDRRRFEEMVDRRYTTSESGSAYIPAETTIEEIYAESDDIITESELKKTAVEGDVRLLLDLFRVSPDFACDPLTISGQELAVRKRSENDTSE